MKNIKTIVLIVEDNHSLLHALVDKLTRENFEVLFATDGKAGLEMALENEPAVIILDILMPIMDGMTMLEKLRQANKWGKQVPVIILTNVEPNNDMTIQVSKYTPTYYLVKSDFKLEDIVDKVNEALG
jgi:DNA-binding response OmpR family regulator